MEKNLETALEMYEAYMRDSLHIFLMVGALVALLFFLKNNKLKIALWVYTILFVFVYACPFTAEIIVDYFIERSVYWRMFWGLPIVMVTAFGGACVLDRLSQKWLRTIILVVLVAAIGVTGTAVITEQNYEMETNIYKLPLAVPPVCQMISKDAAEHAVEQVKVVVPNNLACYIRQYDASFRMPYGRNAIRGSKLTENVQGLYLEMNAESTNYEHLNFLLQEENCTYLVWSGNGDDDNIFVSQGYQLVGGVSEYRIYRIGEVA